jgi:hypothetical protein
MALAKHRGLFCIGFNTRQISGVILRKWRKKLFLLKSMMTLEDLAVLPFSLLNINILKKSCTQFSSFVPAYIVVHPNFNALTMENDFAIITLRDPVYFTTSMSPICLPLSSGSAHENK